MLGTILTTKLLVPPQRSEAVLRRRLENRISAGLAGKLTLVSAPAGFGKTTLISEWAAKCDRPVAWLSLDKEHNEPDRFLAYVAASLRKITPNLGKSVLAGLQSAPPLPPRITPSNCPKGKYLVKTGTVH